MNYKKIIQKLLFLLFIYLARLLFIHNTSIETALPLFSEVSAPEYVNSFPELYAYEDTEITVASDIKKIAYLTFDDGPSKNTEKILDTLKEYNIKATFFIIGSNLDEIKISYLKRAVEEGHVIGMHTYSHDYTKIYSSVENFLADYDMLRQTFEEVLGYTPTIFRFPGGSYCTYGTAIREDLIKEMTRRGYSYFDWNISAEDSVGTVTPYSIHSNIFPKIYSVSSPVVLMHDSATNRLTAELLPDIIEELQAEGYTFETLETREPLHFGE